MSDDLDLRVIHQHHEPDPQFVAALEQRVLAIIAGSESEGVSTDEAPVVEPEPPRRGLRRAFWIGGAVGVAAAALIAGALLLVDDDSTRRVETTPAGPGTTPAQELPPPTGANGWVAFESADDGESDIFLVRPGEAPRPLEVAGSETADDACPAWSPDGTRLLFGRLTGSSGAPRRDAEIVIVPVGRDGAAGAPTVIALDGFDALDGFAPYPCGTWAPDGRWVALRGPGDVWVVDTRTEAVRRLPDLRPVDLEWRPGTDELAIAGDMGTNRGAGWSTTPVTVYSVSTGELRELGPVEAGHVAWSPDGSTLAYTGVDEAPWETNGIWLVDADGANARVLVADRGVAIHGVGPVWSPAGDRIVYQRLVSAIGTGERHEVVLVRVADGTETVIDPPRADGSDEVRWYPYFVTWSPDGTTLLYTAWRAATVPGRQGVDGRAHLIALPADAPRDVTVLARGSGAGFYTDHQWVVTQIWGRQPSGDQPSIPREEP